MYLYSLGQDNHLFNLVIKKEEEEKKNKRKEKNKNSFERKKGRTKTKTVRKSIVLFFLERRYILKKKNVFAIAK